ncbi:hypothetical protein TNCV_3600831 [Trichonephila clavipes]|nr:hypothetical protein TNCV_3600831 [Trichonephila clavipes]
MKNESTTITQVGRKQGDHTLMFQQPKIHGGTMCVWWNQLTTVYYELFKPKETITGALYRTQVDENEPTTSTTTPNITKLVFYIQGRSCGIGHPRANT